MPKAKKQQKQRRPKVELSSSPVTDLPDEPVHQDATHPSIDPSATISTPSSLGAPPTMSWSFQSSPTLAAAFSKRRTKQKSAQKGLPKKYHLTTAMKNNDLSQKMHHTHAASSESLEKYNEESNTTDPAKVDNGLEQVGEEMPRNNIEEKGHFRFDFALANDFNNKSDEDAWLEIESTETKKKSETSTSKKKSKKKKKKKNATEQSTNVSKNSECNGMEEQQQKSKLTREGGESSPLNDQLGGSNNQSKLDLGTSTLHDENNEYPQQLSGIGPTHLCAENPNTRSFNATPGRHRKTPIGHNSRLETAPFSNPAVTPLSTPDETARFHFDPIVSNRGAMVNRHSLNLHRQNRITHQNQNWQLNFTADQLNHQSTTRDYSESTSIVDNNPFTFGFRIFGEGILPPTPTESSQNNNK